MNFLANIVAQSQELEEAAFYQSIEDAAKAALAVAIDIIKEAESLDSTEALEIAECLGKDGIDFVISEGAAPSLNESLDPSYKADVELLSKLSETTLVLVHDLLAEDFEQAVQRILKSDRKLRMTSKDGKTKYKTRRRAAEAAAAACMAHVFGRKGMNKRAAAGKKG